MNCLGDDISHKSNFSDLVHLIFVDESPRAPLVSYITVLPNLESAPSPTVNQAAPVNIEDALSGVSFRLFGRMGSGKIHTSTGRDSTGRLRFCGLVISFDESFVNKNLTALTVIENF
jgi:hypothetical protein